MSNLGRKRVLDKRSRHRRARYRVRSRVRGTGECPRLAVHKSLRFVYAQLIDDLSGTTLAQASSRDADIRAAAKGASASKVAARAVGEAVAQRAKEKGIERVVFDRGGYIYHGKIKELADGARSGGLKF